MPRAKRQRSDSAKAALTAMVNAAKPELKCPEYVTLREQDSPFFAAIIRARARDEWTESDLAVGAQLARCRADIEAESARLDTEGAVTSNARGTPIDNPRFRILQQLAQRQMALMRALRMGEPFRTEDLTKRRGVEATARLIRSDIAAEDSLESLLA